MSEKSHDASLSSPHRHHAAQERHTDARCVPSHLRSALGYRDRGLLPRAVRQDPRQPRGGEQVVEGRLQACRCVPSQVRLRRVPDMATEESRSIPYACWTTTKLCLCPTRESLDFLVKLRIVRRMQPRCSPGECKAAEVDASEQPCLECTHVLLRSHYMDNCPLSSTCTRTGALGTRHVLYAA